MITLAITTGLRRGELRGLQWPGFRLEEGTLQVNHSLTHTKGIGHKLTIPKTKSSLRMVSIPAYILNDLRKYKNIKSRERLKVAELWEGGNISLFSVPVMESLFTSVPGTKWRVFIKRTGFKHIRFHDLKHTAATLLINEGEHAKNISERLVPCKHHYNNEYL